MTLGLEPLAVKLLRCEVMIPDCKSRPSSIQSECLVFGVRIVLRLFEPKHQLLEEGLDIHVLGARLMFLHTRERYQSIKPDESVTTDSQLA